MEYLIDKEIYQKPKKKKNPLLWLLKVIMTFSIAWLILLIIGYRTFTKEELTTQTTIIEINKGETYTHLYQTLQQQWINIEGLNVFFYKTYIKTTPSLPELQVWRYSVPKWATIKELLNTLKYPINDQIKLTVIEGWNIYDIDSYLSDSARELIKPGEFINAATNYSREYIIKYPFLTNQKTLEWYLYPDTYFVVESTFKPEKLIDKMLENFDEKIYKKHLKSLSSNEIYRALKLASIVELEERIDRNKVTIASIFQRRMDVNDFIWADVSACYAYKKTLAQCNQKFINAHVHTKNDYNTRAMQGLPLTPIANPDIASILASINPTKTEYYFYLHDNNGNLRLAKTSEEHQANIQKYLR